MLDSEALEKKDARIECGLVRLVYLRLTQALASFIFLVDRGLKCGELKLPEAIADPKLSEKWISNNGFVIHKGDTIALDTPMYGFSHDASANQPSPRNFAGLLRLC